MTRYLLLASEAGLATGAPLLAEQLLLRREAAALVWRARSPRPRLLRPASLLPLHRHMRRVFSRVTQPSNTV